MPPRVLMLGWEFPPFITGGLGTACLGLTKALDRLGLDTTFVLPKSTPAVDGSHVRLISPGEEAQELIRAGQDPGPDGAFGRAASEPVTNDATNGNSRSFQSTKEGESCGVRCLGPSKTELALCALFVYCGICATGKG